MCDGLISEEFTDDEDDHKGVVGIISQAAAHLGCRKVNFPRKPNVNREQPKEIWSNGYVNWDDLEFKTGVRVHRDTLEPILNEIIPLIAKTPTSFLPNPIEPHRQLELRIGKTWTG